MSEAVERHLDEIAHRHTKRLLPQGGWAGDAAVEDEVAAAAQQLDTLTYPDDRMHSGEFDEKMEGMSPQEARRELEELEAEAAELEAEGGESAEGEGDDPAEEEGKGGEESLQEEEEGGQGEERQEEKKQTEEGQERQEGQKGGIQEGQQQEEGGQAGQEPEPATEGPAGEAAVQQEQQLEAAAAPEDKQEPAAPTSPRLQAGAIPEQGLRPGVAAGEGQTPPSGGKGTAGAAPGGMDEREQVESMQAVAAPEGQLATPAGGRKRRAEGPAQQQEQSGGAAKAARHGGDKRGKRARRGQGEAAAVDGPSANPYLAVVLRIPAGETRTYEEVAQEAGKGPGGGRAVGKALRLLNLRSTKVPWWRVVSADGSLHAGGDRLAKMQLQKLRSEGARPEAGESVAGWGRRMACTVVGCYDFRAERCIFVSVQDERANQFNPTKVERFADRDAAAKRGFVQLAENEVED